MRTMLRQINTHLGEEVLVRGWVHRIRVNELQDGRVQVVLDRGRDGAFKTFPLDGPPRIVVDVPHEGSPTRMETPAADPGATTAPSGPAAKAPASGSGASVTSSALTPGSASIS